MTKSIFYKIFLFLLAVGGVPLLVSLPLEYKNIQDLSQEVSSIEGTSERIEQEINFIVEDTKILILLIAFFTLILVFLVAVLLSRRITTPLKKITQASNRIRKGDLSAQVNITTNDEFKELGDTFNQMTQELKKTNASLKQALTKSKQSQKIAEEEKEKTKSTLDSLVDGLIVLNREKKVDLINPQAQKMLDLEEKQILGQTIKENLNSPKLKKMYDALAGEIQTIGKEAELYLEEPYPRYFQVTVIPIISSNKKMGTMIVLHDITREKRIERMKNEFISIAAHQLRTPLSAMKWSMDFISDELKEELGDKYKGELKRIFQKTQESNERMINLVNDLLNVSRIEEGRFVYKKESISLKSLVEQTIDELENEAQEENVQVKLTKSPDKDVKVKVDKTKLKLALQNLVENAIKYSHRKGKVFVRVKKVKVQKQDYVQVEVEDHGIGISSDDQKRLFDKFVRGDNAMKSQTEGSGLGLFIVKNIIKSHEGKIWFKSKLNEGSTFFFRLPVAKK